MEYLFIFSLIAFLIILITKLIIHIILDMRNGYPQEFGSAWGHVTFFPYDKDVSPDDEGLKKKCNKLQKLTILSLIVFLIVFFARTLLLQK